MAGLASASAKFALRKRTGKKLEFKIRAHSARRAQLTEARASWPHVHFCARRKREYIV